jgi:hypothetical protein
MGYSANCGDHSPDSPSVCAELAEAYLQNRQGVWKVDHCTLPPLTGL